MLLPKLLASLCCLIALTVIVGCDGGSASGPRDKVVDVSKNDPEMQAAIAHAKSTLPTFWKSFDSPGSGEADFALKVEINDGENTEFFWVNPIEKQDGKVFGVINNDPNLVHTVKLGERIEIPSDKIADWMFLRNDKIVGNFTMRALFKNMPPEEVARYKALLVDP